MSSGVNAIGRTFEYEIWNGNASTEMVMMNSRYSTAHHAVLQRIWTLIVANSGAIGDRFERIIHSFYSGIVAEGDTVIDGGAHMGRHALPLASLVGRRGCILAFEPLPGIRERLKTLLAEADVTPQVRLSARALAREPGQSTFFIVQNMLEFSGLRPREYVGFTPDHVEMPVALTTIDAAVDPGLPTGAVSFVKLDLEGGEFRALQGAEATLRAHRPSCAFENGLSSSASDYDADEFFSFFESLDYELFDIFGNPVGRALWGTPGPWYLVAIPSSKTRTLAPFLSACALEEFLTTPWSPAQHASVDAVGPPSASAEPPVVGAMDYLGSAIRLGGWAVEALSTTPARSVSVVVDGTPIGTIALGKPRYDVVAALGRANAVHSGFECSVPFESTQRIEVFAATASGTSVKIADNGR